MVRGGSSRVVMVIPTYNEATNIRQVVGRLRQAAPSVDVLIVDDGSPDGTGEIADAMAAVDPQVRVLHRVAKEGLGAAYLCAFAQVLKEGYDLIGEMDADGSHQPEQLHRLLDAASTHDLVIGSRWIPGGSVINWPWSRRLLSQGGNRYIRLLLGTALSDSTAGYRIFHRRVLEAIDLHTVESRGYVFQVDMATRCERLGFTVAEVPIDFVERQHGDSKMTPTIALDSLRRVTLWGLRQRMRRKS